MLETEGVLDVPLLDRCECQYPLHVDSFAPCQVVLEVEGVLDVPLFGSLRVMFLPMRVYARSNAERRLRLQNKQVEAV